MRYPLPWFPLSEGTSRCSCRTTRGYRPYRSSLLGCRFGRSGSSRFVGGFRPRHWCGCVPVPRVRRNPGRCRDRYICRPVGLLARGDCRPKRIRFPLRGRLKNRNRVRTVHILPLDCRFHAGCGLLWGNSIIISNFWFKHVQHDISLK